MAIHLSIFSLEFYVIQIHVWLNHTDEHNHSLAMLANRLSLHSRMAIINGRSFSHFITGVPKSVRSGENRHVQRNLKKEYIRKRGKSHSSTIWLDRQLRDPYSIRVYVLKIIVG